MKYPLVPQQLFILAFDHRGSFQEKLLHIKGREPTREEHARIRQLKGLIFQGFCLAVDQGVPSSAAGVLIDDFYGADVAAQARQRGYALAMPVEKSGLDFFQFEHGDHFQEQLDKDRPDWVKVLVRHNVGQSPVENAGQLGRLRLLSEFCRASGRRLLFELLVPPTADQLSSVGGDLARYDRELRPAQTLKSVKQIQDFGIEPALWKVEGMPTPTETRALAEAVCLGGRDQVRLVLLGRGESQELITAWFKNTRGLPAYIGFAVGRSIFLQPLKAFLAGQLSEAQAVHQIAQHYRFYYDLWQQVHHT